MKKFRIKVQRTYTTWLDVEEKSLKILKDKIKDDNEDIWEKVYDQELTQMNVEPVNWEIFKINENDTLTGALSPDTGPKN
tara:strand:- start:1536 stop:1775 length:240 start_codon:yes stop_codon:yes gene_type:complete